MRRVVIALGIVAILVSSCGESDLPAGFATTLQDQVALIRQAAEAERPGYARSRLNTLVDMVTSGVERGVIDQDRAMAILESAEAVKDQLSLLPRLSPSEAPSPSPTSPSPTQEDGDGEGDGEGKGKGNGKGNGDEGHGNDD
jgi:hypothetical protein